jgi:hypothetical protein
MHLWIIAAFSRFEATKCLTIRMQSMTWNLGLPNTVPNLKALVEER